MNIGDEVDTAAAILAPEAAISLKAAKAILWVAGILIAGGFAYGLIWWLFLSKPAAEAKHNAVQLQATQGMGQAAVASGHEAVQITVDNSKAAAGIDAAVKGALNEIARAKGADAEIDAAVDDVGRRAICLRSSAAGLPECQSLQHTGP